MVGFYALLAEGQGERRDFLPKRLLEDELLFQNRLRDSRRGLISMAESCPQGEPPGLLQGFSADSYRRGCQSKLDI